MKMLVVCSGVLDARLRPSDLLGGETTLAHLLGCTTTCAPGIQRKPRFNRPMLAIMCARLVIDAKFLYALNNIDRVYFIAESFLTLC